MKKEFFFLNALDKAALSIAILDYQLQIKWVNDVFEEWNKKKEVLGKPFLEVTPNPVMAEKAIQLLANLEESQQVYQTLNLKGRTIRTTINRLQTLQGAYVVMEADVTNLVKAYHYQKVFSSSMGHETKGHLRRSLELINDLYRTQTKDPLLKEKLGRLLFYTGHAFDIVKNLNDWGKPLLGDESPVTFSFFILADHLERVQSRYQLFLQHHQINLIAAFPPDLAFRAEPEMMRTVLRNLISNSMDAIIKQQKEVGKIGGVIELAAEKTTNEIIIKVSDNGGGIPTKEMDSLFTTVEAESFSLGTLLCKELILAHHGDIFIDSPKKTFDTTITIIIPIKS